MPRRRITRGVESIQASLGWRESSDSGVALVEEVSDKGQTLEEAFAWMDALDGRAAPAPAATAPAAGKLQREALEGVLARADARKPRAKGDALARFVAEAEAALRAAFAAREGAVDPFTCLDAPPGHDPFA